MRLLSVRHHRIAASEDVFDSKISVQAALKEYRKQQK